MARPVDTEALAMRAWLRRCLPLPWLLRARRLCYLPLEVGERLLGRRDPSLPPRWLRFVGGGDFTTIGARFLAHFRRLARLAPDEDVLDVGCGVGRIARALAGYLGPGGSYEGFDVIADAVRWCRASVAPLHPRFRFRHADVRNGGYNPRGRRPAAEFVFPYADASFDFVCAASLFTHLLPAEVAHYLREIRRVLRPGGRCLATAFVLNAESLALTAGPRALLRFPHEGPGYRCARLDHPEDAIAYHEEDLRRLFGQAGLVIREPIHAGGWCGREGALEGQDLVLAYREGAGEPAA
jgi:SAM-dependent methyltransferase